MTAAPDRAGSPTPAQTELLELDVPDTIEQSVRIAAPAERVWELVSEPGWFANADALTPHRLERDGDLTTVHDPAHGPFAFRTVALEPPTYAAFRWLADAADPGGASTLVEFTLTPYDGGVELRVVESGFATLPGDARKRRAVYDENVDGWETELRLAQEHLEAGGGALSVG